MGAAVEGRGLMVTLGGHEVLRELTFAVPTGTVTGLLGRSGCGKTTLMRCVVGVQGISSGDLWVLGAPAGTAGLRSRVGYVTQTASGGTPTSRRATTSATSPPCTGWPPRPPTGHCETSAWPITPRGG